MLNQSVIVGRVVREPELNETESGIKVTNLTLAVPRSYKNDEGEYDTDFLNCTLWRGIAENASEYLHKGDLVGVKGRLQSREIEEDGTNKTVMELVAEKVTYLTSKKENELAY